jgi:uncharacterized membrane protein
MRKWIPYLIVAVAVVASVIAFPQLPGTIPDHNWASGKVVGESSRFMAAFTLPFILLLLALMMHLLPRIDPRRANYAKFGGTFEAIFVSIMLFLLLFHFALLAMSLGYPIKLERWAPVSIGVLFIMLGNLMPRARPNWFIGVRTPWTLSSDRVWEKTHRLAGYVLVAEGILVAIMGFTGVRSATFIMGWVTGVAALSLVVYSYVEWRREGGVAQPSSSP